MVVYFSLVESTSFPLISYIETVFIASIVFIAELNVKLFSSDKFIVELTIASLKLTVVELTRSPWLLPIG